LETLDGTQTMKDLIHAIWDQPEHGTIELAAFGRSTKSSMKQKLNHTRRRFPRCSGSPPLLKFDNVYLHGYDDETDSLLKAMPKIPQDEEAHLYDLLSKVFVYDPLQRITAAEMLSHPWFTY
jgi:serine/threonine-protein kinase SRPK3